jgi:hypothetical protein
VRFLVRLLAVAMSIAVVLLIYVALVRPWFLSWGASPEGPPASRSRLYVETGRAIAYSPGYAMVIKPIYPTETRLIARGRGPRGPHLGQIADFFVWDVLYDTVHFVMERKMLEGIKRRAEADPVDSPLADDVQVLLWAIAFAITVASTIGVFFGKRFWPQLTAAWAAIVVWMFLMLVQPSIAVGVPLVIALVVVVLGVLRNPLGERVI